MRKMNDLVNQAIQCNQLGSPIIFIDSCTTHGIYLHRNKSQVSRKKKQISSWKTTKQTKWIVRNSSDQLQPTFYQLFRLGPWLNCWIDLGLLKIYKRILCDHMMDVGFLGEWLKSSRDGRGFLRLLDGFPAISWDSWGIFCRIDYNPREISERLVEILNDSWGDWQEFLELSWHSRGFLPSWCTRMRFLRIIRLFVTILRGFFTAAHATE